MRSRTPLPQRQQAHWGAFLEAAALFLALCVLGRSAALTLAAVVAAPFPAVQTALWWGQRNLQSETSDPEPEPAAEEQAPPASSAVPEAVQALTGGIEDYLVALQPEDARPADAGAVIEKQYPQGGGEKYIACGAGSIKNNTRQTAADLAAEIENPLPFAIEKDSPDPQVLVMHTHATEDYRLSAGLWFTPGDGARSTDRSINMCAVGRVVADTLNAAGIHTLHDETLNDYPSYTGSYANSRTVVQQYLAQYPSIKVVLDVHRDAIETENGSRMAPVCTVDGRQAAQVMIICGCDNGTTVQLPDWRQNLRVAAAWERAMEGMYPGFTRPVLFSYRFYNQDLTTGSLLIEIAKHRPNDKITVSVKRGSDVKQIEVVLRNKTGNTDVITKDQVSAYDALNGEFAEVSEKALKSLKIKGGAVVTGVHEGGLLDKAGIRRGSVITRINNSTISSVNDLNRITSAIESIEWINPDGTRDRLLIMPK